jgi:catecholate siderophore receptor
MLARTTRTVKDQENTHPGQPDHADHRVRHRRAEAHAGDGPRPGQREAEQLELPAGRRHAACRALYRPDPSIATGLNLVRSGARTEGEHRHPSGLAVRHHQASASAGSWAPRRARRPLRHHLRRVALSTAAANPSLPVGTLIPAHIERRTPGQRQALAAVQADRQQQRVRAVGQFEAAAGLEPGAEHQRQQRLEPDLRSAGKHHHEIGGKWDLLKQKLA